MYWTHICVRNFTTIHSMHIIPRSLQRRLCCGFALFILTLSVASADTRRWTGAEHFANPLHDWEQVDGALVATPGNFGSRVFKKIPNYEWARLFKSTAVIGDSGRFETHFQLRRLDGAAGDAGLWLGLKSLTPSPRNCWIHPPEELLFVGINAAGHLVAGGQVSDAVFDLNEAVSVTVYGKLEAGLHSLVVDAAAEGQDAVRLRVDLDADALSGALSLVARGKGTRWDFGQWSLTGDAVVAQPEHAVGAIAWSQYTLQDNGQLKLLAQMVPLEATDPQTADLQFKQQGRWQTVAHAELDLLSSTFVFRVESAESLPYRVLYRLEDETYTWEGVIRANPKDADSFRLGVFNCDHGELFPQDTMVRNVSIQDPDMLYFAGDQIYEIMDNISPVRHPLEGARLSYLSKYFQFGLTWRSLLKDRPSVIIPDDHDVFVGNIWGDNGYGYIMPPVWVNMVQRTQTGSLPDPIDPEPVARGIGVYFTELQYAGMSFAIVEDRKFKSQPLIFTGATETVATGHGEKGAKLAVELFKQDPREMDLPEANLLGERQLRFLQDWTARTEDLPVRWFFSQTMFAKATTHAGPNLARHHFDLDTNGWPQSKRDAALRTLGRDTIMVHGDLHLGVLARMGIDTFDDGPLAFMVTGSCVGFPRAWRPEESMRAPGTEAGDVPFTGRYFDDLKNRLTVLGVTNPSAEPGVNAWGKTPTARADYSKFGGVFPTQDLKGSGHGIITVDKSQQTARFEAYRLDIDAANPQASDQFEGFPITQPLRSK